MHKTIKQVGDDIDGMRFHKNISELMKYTNGLRDAREAGVDAETWEAAIRALLLMLAPSAPHIAEELWARRRLPYSIHQQSWPEYDPELAADEVITIAVQVNGKLRDRITVDADADEGQVREAALANQRVASQVDGKAIARVIYVPGRLLNIMVR
jgi:leucyl-tRNA synthetase